MEDDQFIENDKYAPKPPLTKSQISDKYLDVIGGVDKAMEEYANQQVRIKILDCVKIVQEVFSDQGKALSGRPSNEQNILGNCITVLESDIKNQMKKLI